MGLGFALLLAAETLLVETGSPDALCPELGQAQRAVAERLGSIETPGGQWVARYTMVHAPESASGDHLELTLRDAGGRARLERKLPLVGESCRTLAQAIALVLDRYFRDLASSASGAREATTDPSAGDPPAGAGSPQQADPPPAPSAPRPSQGVVASQPGGPGATGAATPSQPRADDPLSRGGRILFGGGGGYASSPGVAAFGGRAGAVLSPWLRVDLSAFVPVGAREQPLGDERLELRSYSARAAVGFGRGTPRVSAFLGPELLLARERATVRTGTGSWADERWVPGAGLFGWLALELKRSLELGIRGSIDFTSPRLTNRFTRHRATVLGPDQVQGLLTLEALFLLGP